MTDIDAAYQKTKELLHEWRSGTSILGTALSESDTRAKVIDPIFRDVLGWPERNIVREEPAGDGFVDYVLRDTDRAFALIEAKRIEPRFRLPTSLARDKYLIGGPALSDKLAREAILQAAQYASINGCPYAIVTNGFQFVVFRAITEMALKARKALVFADIEDADQFRDFFELLNFDAVLQGALHQKFLQLQTAPSRMVARDRLSSPDRELTRNKLWGVLSHLATRILEDRAEWRLDVIEHCYVPTT